MTLAETYRPYRGYTILEVEIPTGKLLNKKTVTKGWRTVAFDSFLDFSYHYTVVRLCTG